jgi:uncharacterized protein YggU (UPF0235/DUF167 family)
MEARFSVRLTPRGGATRVDGVTNGVLRVRVAPAPVEGAANAALVRLLADELDVPRTDVRLVAGVTGRVKRIVVDGLGQERVSERWPGIES